MTIGDAVISGLLSVLIILAGWLGKKVNMTSDRLIRVETLLSGENGLITEVGRLRKQLHDLRNEVFSVKLFVGMGQEKSQHGEDTE